MLVNKRIKDITGKKFGSLTAIQFLGVKNRAAIWKFKCDCGKIVEIHSREPVHGKTVSCGCAAKGKLKKNIAGKKFGKLTAIKSVRQENRSFIWQVKCDCGNYLEVPVAQLIRGNTKSCGCYQKEMASKASYKGPLVSLATVVYHRYRAGAKKRGKSFNITIDLLKEIIFQNCHYCGSEPANYEKRLTKRRSEILYYNGIDRKNNNIGYEQDNCLPCCFSCNASKRSKTYDEFIEYLNKIAIKWGNKK